MQKEFNFSEKALLEAVIKWDEIYNRFKKETPLPRKFCKGYDNLTIFSTCSYCFSPKSYFDWGRCKCPLYPKYCGSDKSYFNKIQGLFNNQTNPSSWAETQRLSKLIRNKVRRLYKNKLKGVKTRGTN